jgi:hypothetical protein
MRRNPTLGLALAVAAAIALAGVAEASQKLATETGKSCTTCHDKPGSKRLTDAGIYFQAMRTLDGYDAIKTEFGKCTTCHVTKPGSKKLTKQGQQFAGLAKDMSGLQQMMKEQHPTPAAK